MKKYYIMLNVGSIKYIVNFHDGKKRHKDGSEFYDIAIFSNKKKMQEFEKKLLAEGYIHE